MADWRWMSRGWRVSALAGISLVAIAVLISAFRNRVLEEIAEAYFASSGTKSAVVVESWDRSGLHLRVALGTDREFSAERVTIRFDPRFFWPHVDAIVLGDLRLTVAFDGRSFSFGSLQPLIDSLEKPRKKSWIDDYIRAPLPVTLQQAQLFARTPAGDVAFSGTATLSGSRITSIQGRMLPTTLRLSGTSLRIEGSLAGRSNARGLDVDAGVEMSSPQRDRAPARLRLSLGAKQLSWTQKDTGTIWAARSITLVADASGVFRAFSSRLLSLHAQANELHGRSAGGVFNGAAKFVASLSSQETAIGAVRLLPSRIDVVGEATSGEEGAQVVARLTGDEGFAEEAVRETVKQLPVIASDTRLGNDLARAAAAFHTTAMVQMRSRPEELAIHLLEPLTVKSASGASATFAETSGASSWLTFRDGILTGSTVFSVGGGGLPLADLSLQNISFDRANRNRFVTSLQATLALSTTALRHASLSAVARISGDDHALDVSLADCARLRIGALFVKGKAQISDASGALCLEPGQPAISRDSSGWQVRARLARISARFPAAGATLRNGSARFALTGDQGGLRSGTVQLHQAVLSDPRNQKFAPLLAAGTARYGNDKWSGRTILQTTRHRTPIATITAVYNPRSGVGRASIVAGHIRFTPKGLAPSDISPVLTAFSRADGTASFHGQVLWTPARISSGGTLDTQDLQFASPMGTANGGTTHIRFTSLLPLETAPDQPFAIGHVDWLSPIKGVAGRFRLTPEAVELDGARADVAGGTVRVEPVRIVLGAKQSITAALKLSQIDVGQLLADSNLASKVHLQAVASGNLPLSIGSAGVHIVHGVVAATKPGRISIDRSLWTSGTVSSNAMQDFAYQALENLSFDTLRGDINSLPNGRLQIVLHVQGHSDPPSQPETRIGLFELLRGDAFSKPVPLPKGTPIDLTLDTSLNFDELLRAYQAARSPTVSAH